MNYIGAQSFSFIRSARITYGFLIAVIGVALSPLAPATAKPVHGDFNISVLSGRPDMVTAGDALVRVDIPHDVAMDAVVVTLNGMDITAKLRRDDVARTLTGIVDGLHIGKNKLVAASKGQGDRRRATHLTLVNHPKEGPVFSAPRQTPFACEDFTLPVLTHPDGTIMTVPKGQEPDCSITTQVHYFYRTTGGAFTAWPNGTTRYPSDVATTTNSVGVRVKYIVRMEVGSANRGIYTIYILHDPLAEPAATFYAPPTGWNSRLIYTFGTGCKGGWYRQGFSAPFAVETTPATAVVVQPGLNVFLSRGYAVMSSTLNNNSNNCNDVIAAETMMASKERFIEAYGPPRHTMGFGLSGGAMQQHMIADNYPGLLDGIVPGGSFPDVLVAVRAMVNDAYLLKNYFTKLAAVSWDADGNPENRQKRAVTGFGDYATLERAPNVAQGPISIDPRGFCPDTLPLADRYDPVANPGGVRCDLYSAYVNVFGTDPKTGFARRLVDNVGVQYGLGALNAGVISVSQFLDLNEKIGGFDIDGNFVASRSKADLTALRIAYRTGRVTHGSGGLASIPIIDYRGYSDDQKDPNDRPLGDEHLRHFSFAMRERLIKANGHAQNHIMLVEDRRDPPGPTKGRVQLYNGGASALLQSAFTQLDLWLDNVSRDTSNDPPIVKLIRAKPSTLREGCNFRPTPLNRPALPPDLPQTQTIQPDPTLDPARDCARLYPVYSFPRGVAGESIASDIIKCRLKPVHLADYNVPFTAKEWARLKGIFPAGVCDYSKRGVGQQAPKGTWLSFGTDDEVDDDDGAHDEHD